LLLALLLRRAGAPEFHAVLLDGVLVQLVREGLDELATLSGLLECALDSRQQPEQ
jgi:hypothetical protein